MRKRPIRIGATILVLVVIVVALWSFLDWPPPRLILKYGFPPVGEWTGQKRTIKGIEFVLIPAGYFRMGSHFFCSHGDFLGGVGDFFGLSIGTPPQHDIRACPPRWVEIEEPFWIALTEVTCDQYHEFATEWDDYDYGDRPVTNITHAQAEWFCRWLGEGEDVTIRLPTPEEWEYAAAAEAGSPGDDCVWSIENVTDGMEQAVGKLRTNRFGLHDMLGNVEEWCSDGSWRGGSYRTIGDECRADLRGGPLIMKNWASTWQQNTVGFRPAFTAGSAP
jgi:formylglycine-generating enzyme required for sulfatase activity